MRIDGPAVSGWGRARPVVFEVLAGGSGVDCGAIHAANLALRLAKVITVAVCEIEG